METLKRYQEQRQAHDRIEERVLGNLPETVIWEGTPEHTGGGIFCYCPTLPNGKTLYIGAADYYLGGDLFQDANWEDHAESAHWEDKTGEVMGWDEWPQELATARIYSDGSVLIPLAELDPDWKMPEPLDALIIRTEHGTINLVRIQLPKGWLE